MNWISMIGVLMNFALTLLKYAQEKNLIDAGYDKAVAKQALDVLEATKTGKELRDRITAMTDPEAEALWREMVEGSKDA